MKFFSPRGYLIIVFLSFFMILSLGSCKSSQTKATSWTSLMHARELDKKKGKRSKKYQKNVTRAKHY